MECRMWQNNLNLLQIWNHLTKEAEEYGADLGKAGNEQSLED